MTDNLKTSIFGYCPKCNGRGITRERRLDGNDRCENGHVYPSRDALVSKDDFQLGKSKGQIMTDNLKPCPFCGGAAKEIESVCSFGGAIWIECMNCGAGTKDYGDLQMDDCYKAWNTRTDDQLLEQLAVALEKARNIFMNLKPMGYHYSTLANGEDICKKALQQYREKKDGQRDI